MRSADAATIRCGRRRPRSSWRTPGPLSSRRSAPGIPTGIASSSSAGRATTEETGSSAPGCSRTPACGRPCSRSAILPRIAATPPKTWAGRARSGSRPRRSAAPPAAARSAARSPTPTAWSTRSSERASSRPLTGDAARAVAAVNAAGRPIVAADVPSGLSSDAGAVRGPAVRAALTVAFGAPKLCHLLAPASEACGRLVVADIGIPRNDARARGRARSGWRRRPTSTPGCRRGRSSRTRPTSGGSRSLRARAEKPGRPILAARGALRAGAGLVTVFCAESLAGPSSPAHSRGDDERSARDRRRDRRSGGARAPLARWRGFDAAWSGPGLGTSPETVAFLEQLLAATRASRSCWMPTR